MVQRRYRINEAYNFGCDEYWWSIVKNEAGKYVVLMNGHGDKAFSKYEAACNWMDSIKEMVQEV